MYAISRIEAKPGFWCWAVTFRRRGETYSKRFYDVRRGGARKALAAAIAWRDRQLAAARTLMNREFRQLVRSSNRSGAPGVMFVRQKNQPQGMWQAKLKFPDGRQITKGFAVRKYGYREAFERAVAARSAMLALVADRPYLHHHTAKQFAAKQNSSARGPFAAAAKRGAPLRGRTGAR
jgi:hypothetical protein